MAKIPQYTQNKLASSLVGVIPVDTSGSELMDTIANGASQVTGAALSYASHEAAKREAEIRALEKKQQNAFEDIEAYKVSIETESQLWEMIDKVKIDYRANPAQGLKIIQDEGGKFIAETLGNIENPGIKQKAAGIVMNSFRGKLSELHTWSRTQSTANAQTQLSESMAILSQQAGRATNIGQIQELLGKVDLAKNNLELAFGTKKAYETMTKAKTDIAKSYIMGMLDRGQPELVAKTLDSKAFDSLITADERVALKKAANTMIKAKEEADKYDKLLQIISIRQGVALAQANGTYTPSMGMEAMRKLATLEGGKGDYTSIIGATTDFIKDQRKQITEAQKIQALGNLYNAWYKITGGNEKINKSATLEDIVRFQKEVEKSRAYLSPKEYEKFMTKLTMSKTKRLEKMGRNLFGFPKGDLADKDEFSGGFQYIYDWTKKHYKDENQRIKALDEMVTTYIQAVDQVEKAQGGRPLTSKQKWNILKEIQNRQIRKINPHLSNLPAGGQRMADANGNQFIAYPDGSIERIS